MDLPAALAPGASLRGAALTVPRMAVQCQQAVVLLHAGADRDEIFDEQGPATVLTALTHTGNDLRPGQLLTSEARTEAFIQPRPSPQFLAQMTRAFRDALPAMAGADRKALVPQLVRKVGYTDIQAWLTAPAP